jgi:hypothetical protein
MRPRTLLAPLGALAVLGSAATVAAAADSPPTAGPVVVAAAPRLADVHRLDGIDRRARQVAEAIPHTSTEVPDPTVPEGQRVVRVAGIDGTRLVTLAVTSYGTATVRAERVAESVVAEPVTEVVAVGTMPPPPPPAPEPAPGVWDRLAQCESGGNWSINTGNGYYGGLQFSPSTWRAMGGSGLPHQHSRAEQIRVAERLRDADGGYGAWPACSRKLGLPR